MENEKNSFELDYKILHEKYQRLKKLQKLEKTSKEEYGAVNNSSKEINRLIDEATQRIDEMLSKENDSNRIRLLVMKTTLLYERSKFLSNSQNDDSAKEVLVKCLKDINECLSTPEVIYLTLRIINHYAYLLSKREDYNESQTILELGESIYRKAKQEVSPIIFFTSDDLFSSTIIATPASGSSSKLERLVTSNLQMLAFVYNKQGLHDKFADYHHEVLGRQLEMRDDDLLMWSVKAATLASYFLSKNRFEEARHHLAAAVYVLYDYEKELKTVEPSEDVAQRWRELQKTFADTANAWVKYGLSLFNLSKMKAVKHLCEDSSEALERLWISPFKSCDPSNSTKATINNAAGFNNQKADDLIKEQQGRLPEPLPSISEVEEHLQVDHKESNKLFFQSLNLFEYESQVSAAFVESTVQARALYHHTHAWLKKVKLFYTLQDHPMEYVNAILDLSELYRYLAFYEEDIESQYAVQKLRADALETLSTVLREIRPQCYVAVSVELLRELAEIQLEMMGLNLRRIYAAQGVAPESDGQITTINKMEALSDLHSKLQQFNVNKSL